MNKKLCYFQVWVNRTEKGMSFVELEPKQLCLLLPSAHPDYVGVVAKRLLAKKYYRSIEDTIYSFRLVKSERTSKSKYYGDWN